MKQVAKIFMKGHNQAVHLPVNCQFDCDEVYIRQDPETGDVVLSRKPAASWDDYFELTKSLNIPDDFMCDRDDSEAVEKD